MDIAVSIQSVTEEILLKLAKTLREETGQKISASLAVSLLIV